MKKLIPLILITFLCMGNISYAGISDKDRKKFDDSAKKIEIRNTNYKNRKTELRKSNYKRKAQKVQQRKKRKKYNKILSDNKKSAYQHKVNQANDSRSRAKKGEYYLDETKGGFIKK